MNKKLLFAFIFGIFLFSFVSAVTTTDLVSYYKLDDNATNTTVADAHGSNDGTASANTNTLSTTGKINNAFDFESGDTDYVTGLPLLSGDTSFTFNSWIKVESLSTAIRFFSQRDTGDGGIAIRSLRVDTDGT